MINNTRMCDWHTGIQFAQQLKKLETTSWYELLSRIVFKSPETFNFLT